MWKNPTRQIDKILIGRFRLINCPKKFITNRLTSPINKDFAIYLMIFHNPNTSAITNNILII